MNFASRRWRVLTWSMYSNLSNYADANKSHSVGIGGKKRLSASNESQQGSNWITRLLAVQVFGRHLAAMQKAMFHASLNFLQAMSVQFLNKHHRRRDQQQALLKCRLIQAIFGINYLSGDVWRLEKRINNWNYSFVMTSRAASHTTHRHSHANVVMGRFFVSTWSSTWLFNI